MDRDPTAVGYLRCSGTIRAVGYSGKIGNFTFTGFMSFRDGPHTQTATGSDP